MADVVRWVDTQEVDEVFDALTASGEQAALQAVRATWGRDERQRSAVYTTTETLVEATGAWENPVMNTPTYLAMKLYRNYDGNNATFGDTSILTTVPNPDDLSALCGANRRRRDDAHGDQQGSQQCNTNKV